MAIQAVSFGKQAVTKKGNSYEKTNLGGKIGAGVGAAYATYSGIKSVKILKSMKAPFLKKIYKGVMENMPQEAREFMPKFKEYAKQLIKGTKIAAVPTIAISTGLIILAGFGIGKIADAITNKVRANKADSQNV